MQNMSTREDDKLLKRLTRIVETDPNDDHKEELYENQMDEMTNFIQRDGRAQRLAYPKMFQEAKLLSREPFEEITNDLIVRFLKLHCRPLKGRIAS